MPKEAKPIDDRPQCHNKRFNAKAQKRRCTQKGVWCWVSKEFTRHAQVLCNRCITEIRATGWTVRYQLEGDKPTEPQQGVQQ